MRGNPAPPALVDTFYSLPPGYEQRLENLYDPEPAAAEAVTSWQYRVYEMAGVLAAQTRAPRIIDVGCGSGVKLAKLQPFSMELVCMDFGANLLAVKAQFPFIRAVEIDLNTDVSQIFTPAELAGAVIINADNIEHVVAAERLLRAFKAWMVHASVLLLSTPDREKHGHSPAGPPPNRAHVREWSLCEFVRFFSRHGPPLHAAGWTENHSAAKMHITLFVVAFNERLRGLDLPRELYQPWSAAERLACAA